MVISARTKLSLAICLAMIVFLVLLTLGGNLYRWMWPSPEICCVEIGPISGEGIVGLLTLSIFFGAFVATLRSFVIDNRPIKFGSGAKSFLPEADKADPPNHSDQIEVDD